MGILNDNLAELDAAIRAAGPPVKYDGLICDGDDNIRMVYNDGTTKEPTAKVQASIDAFTPVAVPDPRIAAIDGMGIADADKNTLKELFGLDE